MRFISTHDKRLINDVICLVMCFVYRLGHEEIVHDRLKSLHGPLFIMEMDQRKTYHRLSFSSIDDQDVSDLRQQQKNSARRLDRLACIVCMFLFFASVVTTIWVSISPPSSYALRPATPVPNPR